MNHDERARRLNAAGLLALAAGLAANSLLGPLGIGVIDYHFSDSLTNQTIGLDAVSLGLVAPVTAGVAFLTLRGHAAAPALAVGPAFFATYMLVQYVVGPEYLVYPGNSQRFFPFHTGLFVLGATLGLVSWGVLDASKLPEPGRRTARFTAWLFLGSAAFLVFGLHLRGLADAMREVPRETSYLENPTSFWIVKFMDLGIVAPIAVATGGGLLADRRWARKARYAVTGWLALMAAAVTAMAVTMQIRDDPDASIGLTIAFAVITAGLCWAAVKTYLPLFATPAGESARDKGTGPDNGSG